MKKIIFLLVITLLLWATPASALIRTRNVDAKDYGSGESKFKYKVAYTFATTNVGDSLTASQLSVDATITDVDFYIMPFKGTIVGISIGSSAALTAGSVTADVTINGTVTGVRTALDAGGSTRHNQSGLLAAHTQYNLNTLAYDDDSPPDWGGAKHDDTHLYGKATALAAGDRLGVKLTTSSAFAPDLSSEINITVIILQ